MPWGRIDSDFWRHPKTRDLSLAAKGLFWDAVSWCNDMGSDGRMTTATIRKLGAEPEIVEELVVAGLWEREGDALCVHDFLDYNRSAEQIASEKAARSAAGIAGAEARWNGSSHSKSHGKPDAPYPVSRIPVTPIPANPPGAREDMDAADVYWSLTGRYPTGKALTWIDDLIGKYGSEATVKAIVDAHISESTVQTLLGRAQDALRAEARRLDRKEAEEERERLREKRAKPRALDPMEQAFRDALEERYRRIA